MCARVRASISPPTGTTAPTYAKRGCGTEAVKSAEGGRRRGESRQVSRSGALSLISVGERSSSCGGEANQERTRAGVVEDRDRARQ